MSQSETPPEPTIIVVTKLFFMIFWFLFLAYIAWDSSLSFNGHRHIFPVVLAVICLVMALGCVVGLIAGIKKLNQEI